MGVVERIRDFFALERNVLIISLTSGIMSFTNGLWSPFISYYLRDELGATTYDIGVVIASSLLSYVLISIPFGYLADSFGRKKIIVPGTVLIGLAIALYAYAPTWQLFMAMMALQAAVHAAYVSALYAIVADSVPPERRATAYASLSLFGGLLFIPGPIVGGYLHDMVLGTYRPLFLVSGVTGMAMAFVRVLTLRETLSVRNGLRDSLQRLKKKLPRDFKAVLLGERSRTSFLLSSCIGSLAWGVLGSGMMVGSQFMNLYANEAIRLSEYEVGLWQTLGSIFWPLSQVPCGKLADKLGKKRSLILGSLMGFPVTLGFVFSQNILHVLICSASGSISGAIHTNAHSAFVADLTPLEKRATTLSVFTALGSLFQFPGPILGGFLYWNMRPQAPFYANLLLSIPSLLVLIFLVHEPKLKS